MDSTRTRPPYQGKERDFVISIDVGTTFSGTSWVLLDPNQTPEVWDVSGFEGQETQAGSTKVPTVIYYDKTGAVRAVGNQTLLPDTISDDHAEGWLKVEWFKLLLRPDHLREELKGAPKTEIPEGKTLVQVLADYLQYMAGLARAHFLVQMVDAEQMWEEVKDKVKYVLSYPNGWNTFQHQKMREAAVKGLLVPDSELGMSRVRFVSEGEASLHWCLSKGNSPRAFEVGRRTVVLDAGGGTIDVSSFEVTKTSPLKLNELSSPDCYLSGSVFVTEAFRKFVKEKLGAGSTYDEPGTIECIVDSFDKKTKCTWRRKDRKAAANFGSSRDTEKEFNIVSGSFVIEGHEMAEFFEPSCIAAEKGIRAHVPSHGRTTVFLVGGFSGSPWLYSEIKRRVADLDIDLIRYDDSTAKAAARGSAIFYLDHLVNARVAKYTYGVPCARSFIPFLPDHLKRLPQVGEDESSGMFFVTGGFTSHIRKGAVVQESDVTRVPIMENSDTCTPTPMDVEFLRYKGHQKDIEWLDEDDSDQFETLCHFQATIPASCLVRKPKRISDVRAYMSMPSEFYWQAEVDLVVAFGGTEFQCYIEWKDKRGNVHTGSARAIWKDE